MWWRTSGEMNKKINERNISETRVTAVLFFLFIRTEVNVDSFTLHQRVLFLGASHSFITRGRALLDYTLVKRCRLFKVRFQLRVPNTHQRLGLD